MKDIMLIGVILSFAVGIAYAVMTFHSVGIQQDKKLADLEAQYNSEKITDNEYWDQGWNAILNYRDTLTVSVGVTMLIIFSGAFISHYVDRWWRARFTEHIAKKEDQK